MSKELEKQIEIKAPKAIIGLGNPGRAYENTRHNIGFKIVDELADKYNATWCSYDNLEYAKLDINGHKVLLIKPQTYMNKSGTIVPYLTKQGIRPENTLIIHDELELPLGKVGLKSGGSAKGHNGLKSFIEIWGDKFARLRFGVGRPENREDVPNYVLQEFKEPQGEIQQLISEAVEKIEKLYS